MSGLPLRGVRVLGAGGERRAALAASGALPDMRAED